MSDDAPPPPAAVPTEVPLPRSVRLFAPWTWRWWMWILASPLLGVATYVGAFIPALWLAGHFGQTDAFYDAYRPMIAMRRWFGVNVEMSVDELMFRVSPMGWIMVQFAETNERIESGIEFIPDGANLSDYEIIRIPADGK